MAHSAAKYLTFAATIGCMANELLDTTGARIEWLRRKKRGWTQRVLAARVGVGHVYISQLESGARKASRGPIALLAHELGTSVAFLEMETDDPVPPKGAGDDPVYFSPQADEAARLIDAMRDDLLRNRAVELVRLAAGWEVAPDPAPPPIQPVPGAKGGRLVLGDLTAKENSDAK